MMKRWIALVLVLMLLTGVTNALAATGLDGAKKSVARVITEYYYSDGEYFSTSLGSCFAVGKANQPVSYFVTNRHVVTPVVEGYNAANEPVRATMTALYYIIFDNANNRVPANLQYIADEDEADIAVLVISNPTSERQACALRPFETLDNEDVYTIGFPDISDSVKTINAYSQLNSNTKDLTVNKGGISRVIASSQSEYGCELVQSYAPINHGNSGGPMVDTDGRALGINTYGKHLDDDNNIVEGVYYAVSSNELIRVLEDERIPYSTSYGWSIWLIAALVLGAAVIGVGVMIGLQLRKDKANAAKTAAKGSGRALVGTDGKRYPLGHKLLMGRDPKRCKVALPRDASGVSAVHCSVRFDGTRVTVTDEKSSYGTFIGETRLAPGKPTVMHRGQTLYLGSKKNGFTLQS